MQIAKSKRLSQVLRVVEGLGLRERLLSLPVPGGAAYSLKVATDRTTREKAHRLVYEQYLEKGYAQSRSSRAWVTLHDALPETIKLVVEREDEVVSTGTVVPDSQLRLPADEIYAGELAKLRNEGRCPAEVISLAAAGRAEDSRMTMVKLFAAIHAAARDLLAATDLIITVNPRHMPFYRRILLFEQLGDVRACDKVAGAPAVLLRLRLADADRYVREAAEALPGDRLLRTLYPLMAVEQRTPGLIDFIKESSRPMGEEDFGHFFIGLSDVLVNARTRERKYLQSRYPRYDFSRLFLETTVCC